MIYSNDFSGKMYDRLSELEEKLLKSEAERKLLEAKFQFMAESYKSEEERRLKNLREKYAEFMEDCKERSRRNDDILKSLQKVENGANAVYAKTERLKQLRSHYDAYLSRATPLWRHPDILQLPDAAQRSPWIREPRMNMSVTRPALLLPGGGAVMLPVDESGMTVPVGPHILAPDSEVRKLRLSESMAIAKDAKIISTLGEAGQRMIKELKLMEGSHYSYLLNSPKIQPTPVFYQSYHLPVYIPPLYGCAPPTIDYRAEVISPSSVKTDRLSTNVQEVVKKKNVVDDKKKERFEKAKDDFDIECLAADGNFIEEDDANLSDDEVLDVALARSQSPFRNESPLKSDWTNQKTLETLPTDPKYKDSVTPVAKKIVVAHQKSIEELKAMLSFEEDEDVPVEPVYSDGAYTVDEDVPEEFTEQNYTEQNYDPRFQRDVSRNVILEEDEEEEEEKPVISREDEWRRSSYSGSPNNHAAPRMNVERREPRKTPQQYAQQFKALIKKKAVVLEEPQPMPAPIQRQPSRVAVMDPVPAPIQRQPSRVAVMEPVDAGRYNDPNPVSDNGFAYEVKENSPQGQKTNEFSGMPERHEDLNMERDVRDELQTAEFQPSGVYEPEYDANFEQQQHFETYENRYEEPQAEQYQDYQQTVPTNQAEQYQDYQQTVPPNQAEQYQDYQQTAPPVGEYYDEHTDEPYVNPDQEVRYQSGEPMPDYYPEQTGNDYPEQPLENYPPNEFYDGESNQPQYMEQQYGNYEGQPEPEFYDEQQQQDVYNTDEGQRVYEDDPAYAQYRPEPEANAPSVSSPPRTGAAPKPSIVNQLLDSESESYQVDPAGSAPDDSDFDFSVGKS